MTGRAICYLSIIIALSFLSTGIIRAEDAFHRISCIMHIHSDFSGNGENKSIDAILNEAAAHGIDAVIPTDHDIMRWEYGLSPLRGLLRKTYQRPSVLSAGPSRYLDEIHRLRSTHRNMIIVPGVESAPFYYWTGNPFNGTLTMHGWNKHMLLLGMEKEKDYRNLPVVSNPYRPGTFAPWLLWPLILFIPAYLTRKRGRAIVYSVVALCILYNNYPFRISAFDPYHGDRGELPYQNVIDYVERCGGLTFWAHPEAINWEIPKQIGPIKVITHNYMNSVTNTDRATGFGIFAEGYRDLGGPEHLWDQSLKDYCAGKRKKPLWAVGELDYGEGSFAVQEIQNILWVKDTTPAGVMESLRSGRFAALWRQKDWGLTANAFSATSGNQSTLCGGEITATAPVRLRIDVGTSDKRSIPVNITVIRDAKVIAILQSQAPTLLVYEDPARLSPGLHYYRVLVQTTYPHTIAFNPVFVRVIGSNIRSN